MAIKYLLLISRQGKLRLSKWYDAYSAKERVRLTREVTSLVLSRGPRLCNIVRLFFRRHYSARAACAGHTAGGGVLRALAALRR